MSPPDPYPVLRLLQGHLEGKLRGGETRLWLRKDAAEALRELVRMRLRPRAAGEVVEAPQVSAAVEVQAEIKVAVQAAVKAQLAAVPVEPVVVPVVPVAEAWGHPQRLVLPERAELVRPVALEERRAALAGVWERARGVLGKGVVGGSGSPMAELVLVGDAPGADEEEEGRPFVGRAGQLLDKILKVMGLSREAVYLATVCLYRPAAEPGEDRAPTAAEMAEGLEFVKEAILTVQPRVVVVLGEVARQGLGVAGEVGEAGAFVEWEGIPLLATLRLGDLLEREGEGLAAGHAAKGRFWQDMLLVMAKAGLPISDRQRGYFK